MRKTIKKKQKKKKAWRVAQLAKFLVFQVRKNLEHFLVYFKVKCNILRNYGIRHNKMKVHKLYIKK